MSGENPNLKRFQKIVATGYIMTTKLTGAVSQHPEATVEHPECPEGFPRVWKRALSVPARGKAVKVRVTVERIIEENVQ